MNGAYDPLHYVLMFPRGESGFRLEIPLHTYDHNFSHEKIDIYEKDPNCIDESNYFIQNNVSL